MAIRRHSVCNVRAHPGKRLGAGSLGLLRAGVGSIRLGLRQATLSDPDVVLYAATVSVWGRWFVWLARVLEPSLWYPGDI